MKKLVFVFGCLLLLTAQSFGPQVINFGTGVATLLAGAASGTGGPAGTTSPTFTTPILGAAAATSISFGGATCSTYAAGTWTPTLVGSSTPGTGQTYSIQVGSYEQICRQVTVRFSIAATSLGTAAGNIQIGGLPVTSSNTSNDFSSCFFGGYTVAGLAALNYGVVGYINPNDTKVNVQQNGNAGSIAITVAQAGASALFFGTCIYHI